MNDTDLPPLPAPKLRFEHQVNNAGERIDYSANDMRAYVLADRATKNDTERDALRYRWLRKHWAGLIQTTQAEEDLDASVDAAISQEQQTPDERSER